MSMAFRRNWLQRSVLDAVGRLCPLAEQAGLTLAQFALAWVLRDPNVASAIVGASRPEQLDRNAAASDAQVDPVSPGRANPGRSQGSGDVKPVRRTQRLTEKAPNMEIISGPECSCC